MPALTRAEQNRVISLGVISGLTAAVVIIGLLAFYWPWLSNQASFYIFDFTYGWHANIEYIAGQWRAGHLPLWNPLLLCGIPQIAMAAPSPLFPGILPFIALPFNAAMGLSLCVQQVLAFLGMFLLIRAAGFAVLPALLAGTAYGISGCLFSAQVAFTYQAAAAWLPWSAWAFIKIGKTSKRSAMCGWSALAAIFTALVLTSGAVEIAAPLIALLVLYALIAAAKSVTQSATARPLAAAFLRAISLITGYLLALPVLLPAMQLAPLSPRAFGLPFSEVARYSGTWYDFVQLILPQPFGDLYNNRNPFELLPISYTVPLIASAFVGPVIVSLAIRGLAALSRTWRLVMIMCMLITAMIILGGNTAIGAGTLHAFNSPIRYPIKFIIFLVIQLLLLCAIGAQALEQRKAREGTIYAAIFWAVVAVVGGLMAMVPSVGASLATMVSPQFPRLGVMAVGLLAMNAIVIGTCGDVVALIMLAADRAKCSARAAALLLLLISCGTFFWHAFTFSSHPGPADFFERSSPLADKLHELQPNRSLVRFAAMYKDPARQVSREEFRDWTVRNYEHVRQMLVSPNNLDYNIAATVGRTPGEINELYRSMILAEEKWGRSDDAAFEKYCQFTATPLAVTQAKNISYNRVLGDVPILNAERFKLEAENAEENFRVYSVIHQVPRAFFTKRILWGKPHSAVTSLIAHASENTSLDPLMTTVLEHPNPKDYGPLIFITPSQVATSEAHIMVDEPGRVEIKAITPAQNFLVLCDQKYPGWKAFINGKEAPMYTANASFRAVLVPPGEHRVEFRFEPPVMVASAICFALGALLLILLLSIAFRERSAN